MKKNDFIKELKDELSFLTTAEIDKALLYYEELIDDYVDSGLSETEAVNKLPRPSVIAGDLRYNSNEIDEPVIEPQEDIKEIPVQKPRVLKAEKRQHNGSSVAGTIFKILGIFFFCITILPVLVGVVCGLFGAVVGLWATAGALILSGIVIPFWAIAMGVMSGSAAIFFAYLGAGLLILAIGLVTCKIMLGISKAIIKLIKSFWVFLKRSTKLFNSKKNEAGAI